MRLTVAAPMSSISASPGYLARHRGDRIAFNLFILYICFLSRQIESINGASVVTRGEPSPRQTRQTREKRYDPPELPAHRHRRFEHRRHRRPARHGALAQTRGGRGPFMRQLVDAVLRQSGAAIEAARSEEHTSELQSLMRTSYAGVCLKKIT